MTIDQFHVEYKQRINKFDSADRYDFHPAQIDMFANEAIMLATDQKDVGTALAVQLGETFDISQYKIDDLSTLLVYDTEVTAASTTNGKYRYDIDQDVTDFMRFKSARFTVTDCADVYIPCEPVEMDKLNAVLTNVKLKPSLQWRRSACIMHVDPDVAGQRSITIVPENAYTPDKLYLTYIKRPNIVALGDYNGLDGAVSKVEFDLPEHTHYTILELAVLLTHAALDNTNSFNISRGLTRITNLQE